MSISESAVQVSSSSGPLFLHSHSYFEANNSCSLWPHRAAGKPLPVWIKWINPGFLLQFLVCVRTSTLLTNGKEWLLLPSYGLNNSGFFCDDSLHGLCHSLHCLGDKSLFLVPASHWSVQCFMLHFCFSVVNMVCSSSSHTVRQPSWVSDTMRYSL